MLNIFKNAFIRKIAYLIAGLIITLAMSFFNEASAASFSITGVQGTFNTPLDACTAYKNAFYPTRTATVNSSFPYSCYLNGSLWSSIVGNYPVCTPPSTLNNLTGLCETPNPCLSKENQTVSFASTTASSTGCVGGCKVYVAEGTCGHNNAGQQGCFYVGTFGGEQCTVAPNTEPQNSPEYDCIKQGKSYGTVNGTVSCVAKGSPGSAPVTTTETKKKTENSPDGTKETTKEIKRNADGTVTTITTIVNNNGSPTTTEKTEPQSSFCEDNPNSKICKDDEKSSFTGSCEVGFSCDGDAIQCAIAKKQHSIKCEYDNDIKDIKLLSATQKGEKLLKGDFDLDVQSFIDGTGDSKRTVNLSTQIKESGNAHFSGDGIQDLTFTVMSKTITLPLSNYNKYLEYMGSILLALSYFAAFRIVMGSIR